jgi:glucosamine-6-phosphate deaminase
MPSLQATETRIVVQPDYDALCRYAADRIDDTVSRKPNAVLGLATGSTPIGVYRELVRRYRAGTVDFSQVTCFNLDEYSPMSPDDPQSYYQFMKVHLFDHINCRNWQVPDGRSTNPAIRTRVCEDYQADIKSAGGIDLQLLGVGRTGHLGFNEPGSAVSSRTRVVALDEVTRYDAACNFGGLNSVPREAVTMGLGDIMEARELLVLASGAAKAEIVHLMMTARISEALPASFVRLHQNATICLDAQAAWKLK